MTSLTMDMKYYDIMEETDGKRTARYGRQL